MRANLRSPFDGCRSISRVRCVFLQLHALQHSEQGLLQVACLEQILLETITTPQKPVTAILANRRQRCCLAGVRNAYSFRQIWHPHSTLHHWSPSLLRWLIQTITSIPRPANSCQKVLFSELRARAGPPTSTAHIAELSATHAPAYRVSCIDSDGTLRKTHVIWLQPVVRAITRWHFAL